MYVVVGGCVVAVAAIAVVVTADFGLRAAMFSSVTANLEV